MKNFVQEGNVIDYTAGANLSSGAVVLIGVRIGVLVNDLANGATGPARVLGVFSIAKLSTDVVTRGAALYWDNTNSRLTVTASGNTLAGYATAPAGNGVTTVNCHINA